MWKRNIGKCMKKKNIIIKHKEKHIKRIVIKIEWKKNEKIIIKYLKKNNNNNQEYRNTLKKIIKKLLIFFKFCTPTYFLSNLF